MSHTVKKVWNIVSGILVALVIIMAILLVGVRLVGLQVFDVLSGSMEPTYHTGSLIYVREIDPADVQLGQAITFRRDSATVVTHRVVEIVTNEEDPTAISFRTKGDANDSVDGGTVQAQNVIGTPVFTIPYLGYVAEYVQNPPGMYVAICGCALLLLMSLLPDLLTEDDKKKHTKKQPEPQAYVYDPRQPVSSERIARLRRMAETVLTDDELWSLNDRLSEGPLTLGEYWEIREYMEQLSENAQH